ncbi:RagB/SusD family nutrient uptake outer membrane protein [bacterium]|nr:MAG: RagB/SusD family nutrient uptake outer membrane protein [bacterium]
MLKRKIWLATILCICITVTSCKKEWLEAKRDKSLVVPVTLSDYQSLLDNTSIMNLNAPALGHFSSDDIYIENSKLNFIYVLPRNAYQWKVDIYEGAPNSDWDKAYQRIYYANLVMEGIDKIKVTESNNNEWNMAKGIALFDRSLSFSTLLDNFSKQFDSATASTDLGIPLKLTSDINEVAQRSTVNDCYLKIIADLKSAADLLPKTYIVNRLLRPSKQAAFAQLARIYLIMGNFDEALFYSNEVLKINSTLMNFSEIDATKPNYSIAYLNTETLLYTQLLGYSTANIQVNPTVYNLYSDDDLRKQVYFNVTDLGVFFKGNYSGNSFGLFNGTATDEIYLIRAECYARKNKIPEAMADLNALLTTRWKPGTYLPYTATTIDDAMNKILVERRKELLFRGIRWTDLRRLNKEAKYAITLMRQLESQSIMLLPNDNKYVFAIPDSEILYNNIPQNNRQ